MRKLILALAVLSLTGCIQPGQYVDDEGRELRNNCLIQTVCLDVPSNRPGASTAYFFYYHWGR